MASADTSIFTLVIGGHKPDTFRVLEFTGQEALSENFCFRVKAIAYDVHLKYEDTIGNAVALIVKGVDYEVRHFGMITHFNQVPESHEGVVELNFYYEFTIEPNIKHMAYHLRSRIFQNQSAKEIVEEVIGEYVEKDTAFKFEAKFEDPNKDYSKREFTVQYNETDWDFVRRLLEDEGIYWYWNHEGDRDVLIMANRPDQAKPIPNTPELPYMSEGGLTPIDGREYVDSMERSVKFVTGRASIRDYNYRTPDVNVTGQFETVGPGGYHHFGDHVKTTDEATRKAQLRAEMFACQRETYKGTGIFRSARPGYRFKLVEASAEGFNGEYLLTRVTHLGTISEVPEDGSEEPTVGQQTHYRCAFEAIPAKTVFRPPLLTPKPKANGILTALIDGQKDKYAYIDEEGRYKVKLFFDPSAETDGKASKAIRLAQPYAGPGYGMHFPLHTGTEIAIGFVDGDLDRPIGLGAVPNPGKGSPVKTGNKSQNMIKSHSGHSITLDDKEGKTGIHISTSGGHSISMDDAAGSKGISLGTSGKYTMVLDDKGQLASIATKGGHSLTLTDADTNITIASTGKLLVKMDDAAKSITVSGGPNSMVVDQNKSTVSIAADAHITLTATSDITLTAGSSSITLAKDGTITIAGKTVNITGSDAVNVGGKAIAINGSDKVSATSSKEVGLGAASSAVSVKPDGVSTSGPKLSASAIGVHEIGGALIKIG